MEGEKDVCLPHSVAHDNTEMLKVAAVVQGLLADAVAGSERLVFIAAVSQVILCCCGPANPQKQGETLLVRLTAEILEAGKQQRG